MKSKALNKTGNFIRLSGEIDKSYTIAPGVKITFGEGSTFEGIEVAKGTTFCNNEYVVKHFTLNFLGQIELTPISVSSDQDHEAPEPYSHQVVKKTLALIIPSSGHPSAFGEDSSFELGIPEELIYKRPLAPTAEKDSWSSSPPDSPISVTLTPPTPTFHGELSPGNLLSSRPPSIHNEPNEAILSGENAEASSCCCIVL